MPVGLHVVLLVLLSSSVCASRPDPKPFHTVHGHRNHHNVKMLLSNNTFEIFPGFKNKTIEGDVVTVKRTHLRGTEDYVPIRISTLEADPLHHFSILEPGGEGGCFGDNRARVSKTSGLYNCMVAGNAGFFNVDTGACLGNLVSRGRLLQNTGLQNANFGVRSDGSIVVGYLNEDHVADTNNPFENLVAGVIWLVRDGKNYVQTSGTMEYMGTQNTGGEFITLHSARGALGHDKEGRLVLVQADGKSWQRGIDLYQMADFLVQHGIVNAINLDGGGSLTSVMGGDILVNMPSDDCPFPEAEYFCERKVTTIVCFHHFRCINNSDCTEPDHACVKGECVKKTLPPQNPPSSIPCNVTCAHGECDTTTGLCSCKPTWGGHTCEADLCAERDAEEYANYTEWRDLLHPHLFKEYAVLSSIAIGITALITCVAFGVIRLVKKELVTSYVMTEDLDNEMVNFSESDSEEKRS